MGREDVSPSGALESCCLPVARNLNRVPESRLRVGKLSGAKASVACSDRVLTMFLVFRRKGGSPVYWLRLDATRAHESENGAILESIGASFKLIRWE